MDITDSPLQTPGLAPSAEEIIGTLKDELQRLNVTKAAGNIRSISDMLDGMVGRLRSFPALEQALAHQLPPRAGRERLSLEEKKILVLAGFARQNLEVDKIFQLGQGLLSAAEVEETAGALKEVLGLSQSAEKNVATLQQICLYLSHKLKAKMHVLQIIKEIYTSINEQLESLESLLRRTEIDSLLFADALQTIDDIREALRKDFSSEALELLESYAYVQVQEEGWKNPRHLQTLAKHELGTPGSETAEEACRLAKKLLEPTVRVQLAELLSLEKAATGFLTNWKADHLNLRTATLYMAQAQEQLVSVAQEQEASRDSWVPAIRVISLVLAVGSCLLLANGLSLLVYQYTGERYQIALFKAVLANTKQGWYILVSLMALGVGFGSAAMVKFAPLLAASSGPGLTLEKCARPLARVGVGYILWVVGATIAMLSVNYMFRGEKYNLAQGAAVLIYGGVVLVLAGYALMLFSRDKHLVVRLAKKLATVLCLFAIFALYITVLWATTVKWVTSGEIKLEIAKLIFKHTVMKSFSPGS